MTTILPASTRCAFCGNEQTVQVLGSTNRFGSPDLDLRPPPMERNTLEYRMHECEGCGFVAPDLSEPNGDAMVIVKSPEYREQLRCPENPPLANRYLARAMIHRAAGQWAQAAWSCLTAAWVCDDEEKAGQAGECRIRAIADFGLDRKHRDGANPNEVEELLVLIDVNRRAGQFDAASELCHALEGRPELKDALLTVWRFQCELIARRDTAQHTVSQAFETRPDSAASLPS